MPSDAVLTPEQFEIKARLYCTVAGADELIAHDAALREQVQVRVLREALANAKRRVSRLERGYDNLRTICNRQQHELAKLREQVELMRPAYEDQRTYIGRARANYRRLSARTPEAGDGE